MTNPLPFDNSAYNTKKRAVSYIQSDGRKTRIINIIYLGL